ncbi:MAG TPA: tetratricopeptide repeat protein, partial [Candidatus Krumholzibacterium sp.]|nr:tetratricopeptide repeat protein [Candidatus Krumholzibacterium sp.]
YYVDMARDIAGGNWARREAFFMGPLYPYLMAFVFSVFGKGFTAMRLIQASGGAFTVVLTYIIGTRMFRPSVAMLGALLLALYGTITFFEGQLLMTWLGTLFNLLLLYVLLGRPRKTGFLSLLDRHYTVRPVAAGVLLGLSALARASILVLFPVILAWIFFVDRDGRRLVRAAVFTAGVMAAILPVTLHNRAASGDTVLITSNGGMNFYIGNNPSATGVYAPPMGIDVSNDITTERYLERRLGRDLGPSEISGFWLGRAMDFIREDPGREISLLLRKSLLLINGYEWPQIESYDLSKGDFGIFRLLFVNFWMISALGIAGMLFSVRRWRELFLLHWFVIAYSLSIILFFVTDRYRVQAVPVLSLFAAYAAVETVSRLFKSPKKAWFPLLLVAALLLLTRPGLFAIDRQRLSAQEHIHRAIRYNAAGQTESAIGEVDKAIRSCPEDTDPYIQRAAINRDAGRLPQAIADYGRALEMDPDMPHVRYSLAILLEETKDHARAAEEYRKAIEQDPLMIEAYNNLGILYRQMKQYEQAIRYFRQVLVMDPDYIKAYNNMGAAYAESGDRETAIIVFQEAIRRAPDYPHSYKNLAMAYIETNRLLEAKANLEKCLELAPDDALAARVLRDVNAVIDANYR